MPYYCTVPRCTSMAGKAKNVSFHQFPRDEELARLWNDILKRGKPYTKYSKVCSLHFKPEDYTITSVGKNKGQWRTLRKDAVPSQNLPSETPAPYSRKQWESWSHPTSNIIDPTIQQQMAQAIYMQTMLAMQAATSEPPSHQKGSIPDTPHTSNQEKDSDITSYKCTECTKCFKDPDVFILHKRTHTKKCVEKENFNMNLTLRSNPILANLLKTNNDVFDPNLATMESILITALAANMDYLRNFSMVKEEGENRGELNHETDEINHRDEIDDGGEMNHVRDEMNQEMGEMNHGMVQINQEMGVLNHDRGKVNHDDTEMNKINLLQTDHSEPKECNPNNSRTLPSNINHLRVRNDLINDPNQTKSDVNENSDDENHHIGLSYAMNFSTKIDREKVYSYYKDSYCSEGKNSDAKNVSDDELNVSYDSNLVIDESV